MRLVSLSRLGILAEDATDEKGYKFAIFLVYLVPCLILRKLIVAIRYPKFDIRDPTSNIRDSTSDIWHPRLDPFFLHSILAARAGDLLLLDLSVPFSQNSSLNLQKNSKLQGTAKVDTHATLESLAFSFRMLLRRVLERMALEQSLQKIARERERERSSLFSTSKSSCVG